ncbi:hypothetical protein [Sphingobacterium multivorum]|uniref:hypothetical protein n=1 Tax=Sphingobacterium multivorum TaxID=28454 RepID=UPI002113C8A9|nr:hypothetical protein [Sphingobacterium multivorum]
MCKELGLSKYFQTINGSPTAKIDLVSNLLEVYTYSHSEVALIGDSVNDKEAADLNAISFLAIIILLLVMLNIYINLIINIKSEICI